MNSKIHQSIVLEKKTQLKIYLSPQLVCYGEVKELTKGGGSKPGDALAGGSYATKTGVG